MVKKKKNKKLKLHPITGFIVVTIAIILLSAVLSLFHITVSYDSVNIKNSDDFDLYGSVC